MKNKVKGLLAFDLDGTLVPKGEDALSVELLCQLRNFHEMGWKLLFATGRTWRWTKRCLRELACPYEVSILNGVLLKSMPLEDTLFQSTLPLKIVRSIEEEMARRFGPVGCLVCSHDGDSIYLMKESFSPVLLEHMLLRQNRLNEIWNEAKHMDQVPLDEAGGLGLFFDNEQKAREVSLWLESNFPVSAPVMRDAYSAKITLVLVTSKKANKGKAVTFCRSLHALKKRHVIAVGDDMNDMSMFEKAGYSIAFVHSPHPVQHAADVVVESTTNHSIHFLPHIKTK